MSIQTQTVVMETSFAPNSSLAPISEAMESANLGVNTAFVLDTNRQFSYESRPISELPSSKHVRVRVVAIGLCGSDVSSDTP